MPLITIRRNTEIVSDQLIEVIEKFLISKAVRALNVTNVPEERLTEEEIEIHVNDKRALDRHCPDLAVRIEAESYRLRVMQRKKLNRDIRDGLEKLLKGLDIRGYVEIRLSPGAFDEFST